MDILVIICLDFSQYICLKPGRDWAWGVKDDASKQCFNNTPTNCPSPRFSSQQYWLWIHQIWDVDLLWTKVVFTQKFPQYYHIRVTNRLINFLKLLRIGNVPNMVNQGTIKICFPRIGSHSFFFTHTSVYHIHSFSLSLWQQGHLGWGNAPSYDNCCLFGCPQTAQYKVTLPLTLTRFSILKLFRGVPVKITPCTF